MLNKVKFGAGVWVRIRDFERSMYEGSVIESPRFFRTADARRVGGFDEDIVSYEESTLPQKIGGPFSRTQACIFHDENGFDLKKWLRKKAYYNESTQKYAQRYPELASKQFSIGYRLKLYAKHWRRLLRNPFPAAGVFILKTLEYVYSR